MLMNRNDSFKPFFIFFLHKTTIGYAKMPQAENWRVDLIGDESIVPFQQ